MQRLSWLQPVINPIKRSLLGLLVFLLATSLALAAPSIQPIDKDAFAEKIANLESISEPIIELVDMQLPSQTGKASITTMFSAQHGSWPFESFAINNLFRVIATYQAYHPRMVIIRGGTINLSELNKVINNEKVIRPFKDGYLLSYPLLIDENAALQLDNTTLYLYSYSGTAIINKGLLAITKSTVESWSDNKATFINNNVAFRPFIINWGGSRLQIIDSKISKLGYNAYLVQGITTAINNNQPTKLPVQVQIENSEFTALSSINLKNAQASINNSIIKDFQQYGIDLMDSQFKITNNKIQAIKNNSGIRVQGDSNGIIENNAILSTHKASIETQQMVGKLVVRKNILAKDSRHGLLLNNANATVIVKNNLFTKLTGTAIEANQFEGSAYILNNTIHNTPEYAVSFRNEIMQKQASLIFYKNKLTIVGKPILRTLGVGHITIGDNKIVGSQFYQNLLIGDLLPIQGTILEATLKNSCIVEVNINPTAIQHSDIKACK